MITLAPGSGKEPKGSISGGTAASHPSSSAFNVVLSSSYHEPACVGLLTDIFFCRVMSLRRKPMMEERKKEQRNERMKTTIGWLASKGWCQAEKMDDSMRGRGLDTIRWREFLYAKITSLTISLVVFMRSRVQSWAALIFFLLLN